MYNVPTYRIRAYIRGLKRPKATASIKRKPLELHLKKAEAELQVTDGYAFPKDRVRAMVVLNELGPKGLSLYSESRFQPGQQVSLTINEPRRFYARARVISVEHVSARPAVISESPLPYRITVVFEYENLDELMAVKKYCDELAAEHLYPRKKPLPRPS